MLIDQLNEDIQAVLASLEAADQLDKFLKAFSSIEPVLAQAMQIASKNTVDGYQNAGQTLTQALAASIPELREFRSATVFDQIRLVKLDLFAFARTAPGHGTYVTETARLLDELQTSYEHFLNSHSFGHAAELQSAAIATKRQLRSLLDGLTSMSSELERLASPSPDHEVVDIVLQGDHSLQDTARVFGALAGICEVIEQIEDQPAGSSDARVIRAETDCLAIKLLLTKWAAGLFRSIAPPLIRHLYATHTNSGQLSVGIPEQAAALREVIKSRRLLRSEGLSTAEMDADIEQMAANLAKYGRQLTANRVKVRIDKDQYADEETNTPPRLEGPARRLALPGRSADKSDGAEGAT